MNLKVFIVRITDTVILDRDTPLGPPMLCVLTEISKTMSKLNFEWLVFLPCTTSPVWSFYKSKRFSRSPELLMGLVCLVRQFSVMLGGLNFVIFGFFLRVSELFLVFYPFLEVLVWN